MVQHCNLTPLPIFFYCNWWGAIYLDPIFHSMCCGAIFQSIRLSTVLDTRGKQKTVIITTTNNIGAYFCLLLAQKSHWWMTFCSHHDLCCWENPLHSWCPSLSHCTSFPCSYWYRWSFATKNFVHYNFLKFIHWKTVYLLVHALPIWNIYFFYLKKFCWEALKIESTSFIKIWR